MLKLGPGELKLRVVSTRLIQHVIDALVLEFFL